MNHIEWLVFCLFRNFQELANKCRIIQNSMKKRVAIAPCLFTNLVGIHRRIMSTYYFKNIYTFNNIWPFWDTSVVSMSASYGRLRVRARLGHTKDHYKKYFQPAFLLDTHALEYQFDSAARRFERLDSVWNCLWGHALTRSGINRKSRVLYPSPGFLHSLRCQKMHYNRLFINQEYMTSGLRGVKKSK